MGDLLHNRSLNLADYQHPHLAGYVSQLRNFRDAHMRGLFYRNDHAHRDWEYAEVLRKLDTLWMPVHDAYVAKADGRADGRPTESVRILDTGFGCSYFTQFLKLHGWDVHASDSEAYGAVREKLIEQCVALGTKIPLIIAPVEDHGMIPDGHFDVSMCISVIEHVPREGFALA
jgi:2-polyprenyl-3-methyl-5-hydroxy-6-metoxy-1,4-benzoquinol methylase